MRCVPYLPHGLGGTGAPVQGTACVPVMPPLRPWADTWPWAALVRASAPRCATRCPTTAPRGRRPVPRRVLGALEVRTHALGASAAARCHRVRTDWAVMEAGGVHDDQGHPSPAHCVCPETRCAVRRRMDEALRDARSALHAAAALEEGLGRPAPRVLATVPRAQGRQRVTEATTREPAHKNA